MIGNLLIVVFSPSREKKSRQLIDAAIGRFPLYIVICIIHPIWGSFTVDCIIICVQTTEIVTVKGA